LPLFRVTQNHHRTPSQAPHKSPQQIIHFSAERHRWSSASPGYRNARHGAAKTRCLDNVPFFGECHGETSAECISGACGLNHRACVTGWNVLGCRRILHQRALRSQGDDYVARTVRQEHVRGGFRIRQRSDPNAGKQLRFRLIRRHIVAVWVDRIGQLAGRRWIQNRRHAQGVRHLQAELDRRQGKFPTA